MFSRINRALRQFTGRLITTGTKVIEERQKNKFLGDGVEFLKNALHKDNLPFLGVFTAGIYFLSRGSAVEARVDVIEKTLERGFSRIDDKFQHIDEKFDHIDEKVDRLRMDVNEKFNHMDEKLDRHFSVIMALTSLKRLPDEIVTSLEKEKEKVNEKAKLKAAAGEDAKGKNTPSPPDE